MREREREKDEGWRERDGRWRERDGRWRARDREWRGSRRVVRERCGEMGWRKTIKGHSLKTTKDHANTQTRHRQPSEKTTQRTTADGPVTLA